MLSIPETEKENPASRSAPGAALSLFVILSPESTQEFRSVLLVKFV